jgi:hypothetical protein
MISENASHPIAKARTTEPREARGLRALFLFGGVSMAWRFYRSNRSGPSRVTLPQVCRNESAKTAPAALTLANPLIQRVERPHPAGFRQIRRRNCPNIGYKRLIRLGNSWGMV